MVAEFRKEAPGNTVPGALHELEDYDEGQTPASL